MQALGSHIAHGGLYISEHPGMPTDLPRPTIWRAPLTELMRKHPEVRLSHINQWRWGAEAIKPTGLLAHRLPKLLGSLYSCSLPDAKRPSVAAIGKSREGEFRTARLKEYPVALSAALAAAFCEQVRADMRAGRLKPAKGWDTIPEGASLRDWVRDTAEVSASIRQDATILPDYQPRWRIQGPFFRHKCVAFSNWRDCKAARRHAFTAWKWKMEKNISLETLWFYKPICIGRLHHGLWYFHHQMGWNLSGLPSGKLT